MQGYRPTACVPALEMTKIVSSCSCLGSSALNPGAVFLRFFTVAFLLFLTPAGGATLWGQLSTLRGNH